MISAMKTLAEQTILLLRRRGLTEAADEAARLLAQAESGQERLPAAEDWKLDDFLVEMNKRLHLESLGYRVRIRIHPEPTFTLQIPDGAFEIRDEALGTQWTVRVGNPGAPGDSPPITVTSTAFTTREEALVAAEQMKAALIAVSLEAGCGFAMTHRVPPTVFTEYGLSLMASGEVKVLQDQLGSVVFQTPPATVFVYAGPMQVGTLNDATFFAPKLQTALNSARAACGRVSVAFELYASSRMENSARARFLLLVMAVEALVVRQQRSSEERALVDQALALLEKAKLSSPTMAWESMAGVFRDAKRESISSAARRLFQSQLSEAAALKFKHHYALRSNLVHGNSAPPAEKITDAANELEQMVREVLIKLLASESGSPLSR
jgi:Apea-like HEPN